MPHRVIEVLVCGTHRLPDGRTVTFDRARLARICEQANRQKAARIRFPLAWMHDPRAVPLELSQQDKLAADLHPEAWLAKGYFGEAVRYAQDPATGNLLAKVSIPDEADARQFDKVGQVSPSLWQGWTDERNVHWPELTIAHIAATPKPVQRDVRGRPAHPAHLLLSQPARVTAAFQLSFPATPRSEPMADEYDDDTEMGGDAAAVDIAEVIELLKKLDIHGMDGVTEETLVPALKAAVHTKLGDTGESDGDEKGEGEEMGGEKTEEVAPPMFMSHPVGRKMADELAAYKRKDREARLNGLLAAKKVNKAVHEKLSKQLSAVNLSQAGTIDFAAFDAQLDLLDELTPVAPLAKGPVNLGYKTKDAPNPSDTAGPHRTAEQLDVVRRERAKQLNIKLKQ